MEELRAQIRKKRPVVHCITNIVMVNDCANVLLAVGASPVMAHDPREVAEVTEHASALVCNMGAMESYDAMLCAGNRAFRLGHPIVLDPVGVAGSSFRREQCLALIDEIHPTCIRGNYAEIQALMEKHNTAAGVDSTESSIDREGIMAFAKEKGTIVVASGIEDYISDGEKLFTCKRGDPLMSRITGCGCMSSSLLGAYLSLDISVETVTTCVMDFGIAGEQAAKKTREQKAGSMTFRSFLIDQMYVN